MMNLFDISGRNYIITGAASGIGLVVAHQMAQAGANLALVGRTQATIREAADKIAKEHGIKCHAYTCDIASRDSVIDTVSQVEADFETIHGLFNNAGTNIHARALDVEEKDWEPILDVNVTGTFYMAQAVAKHFIKRGVGGSIVNNASINAHVISRPQSQTAYDASKAAVVQMTKSLAIDWVEYGIRVNSISPGYILTKLAEQLTTEEQRKVWAQMTPYKRLGKPEELAGAVIYFLSDASTFTSGSDLIIDGCYTCL